MTTTPTLDNTNIGTLNLSVTSVRTISAYTPTAGCNKLVVAFHAKDNASVQACSSVTYDGNAMSKLTEDIADTGSGFNNLAQIWEIADPLGLAASGDIVVNLDDTSTILALQIYAVSITGAASAAPTTTEVGHNSSLSAGSLSASVTTKQDNTLIFSIGVRGSTNGSVVATSPHTEDAQLDISGSSSNSSSAIGEEGLATAGTRTPEWTGAAGNRMVVCAACFAPTPDGGSFEAAWAKGSNVILGGANP